MGTAFHIGGALAGIGQEAYKSRVQQHEDEIRQQAMEYQALSQLAEQSAPEYHQQAIGHALTYAMAKPGPPGDKQRQQASSSLLQLVGGQGPGIQYRDTSVGGDPRYAATVPNQSAQPLGQMPIGGGSNLAQLLGGASVDGSALNPAQTMMQNAGGRFNGPAPGAPMGAQVGFQSQAPDQVISDFGQGSPGASPNVATAIPQPRTPQLMTQTGNAPVSTARTPIPFLEDPIARKLREQQALNPGLIDLYRGKTDATTNSKIAINRAKIDDQLDKELALIDPKMKAQVKAYATRGVMKRVAELGGDPTNPDDVKEATSQLTNEINQNYTEHTQKIAKLKADAAAVGTKLEIAKATQKTREDALNLQKDKTKNLQDWRSQKANEAQIKRDVDQLDKRRMDTLRDLDRIGKDPRLLNPDKYPDVAKQLQDTEDKLRKLEEDIQSANEGKAGASIAARGGDAGAPAVAGFKKGQIITKKDGSKVVVDSVTADGKPLVLPYP
jgi:hypothetical protein